jgi:hypothetical protein
MCDAAVILRMKGNRMAAMNISVPDDLRKRMDGVSGVTWSQVAAKAFELEVNSRTMGKDNDDMTAAIKRLKASRQKAEQEDRASGLEHGRIWAMNDAEWAGLCAVTRIGEHTEDDDFTYLGYVLQEHGYDAESLYDIFGRDLRFGNGDPPISDAEVRGFIEGARLVLDEVKRSGLENSLPSHAD